MKLRLTYLLLLGLIFSGVYAFTAAPGHKDVSNISSLQVFSNNKTALFTCSQQGGDLSFPLVYLDNGEDEEEDGTGKKISFVNLSYVLHSFFAPHIYPQRIQTKLSYAASIESSFPRRYLHLRVIRV